MNELTLTSFLTLTYHSRGCTIVQNGHKKENKNVNSKTPTAILQKNILYISFGLPLRPKLHFKIQIPTGLLKGSICSVFVRLKFIFVICLVFLDWNQRTTSSL